MRDGTKLLLADEHDILLLTGNYGSGKTEVSVNLAISLARAGRSPITIVDLDLVNPYFRCREARKPMEQLGIRVVAPEADLHSADLPILLPQVRGSIESPQGPTILDVGGDNVGATVLASISPILRKTPHAMWFVLNQSRPFTDTISGAMQIMDEIEGASRLTVTGIVGNTHMMEETDLDLVAEGADFCSTVAKKRGIELAFVTAHQSLLDIKPDGKSLIRLPEVDAWVLPIERNMVPPWLGGPTPGSLATHSRDGFTRITQTPAQPSGD